MTFTRPDPVSGDLGAVAAVRPRRRPRAANESLSAWVDAQVPIAAALAAEGWLPTDLVRAFYAAAVAAGHGKGFNAVNRSPIGRRVFDLPAQTVDQDRVREIRAWLEANGRRRRSGYYLAARARLLVSELMERILQGEFREAVYRDIASRLSQESGLPISDHAVRDAIRVAAARPAAALPPSGASMPPAAKPSQAAKPPQADPPPDLSLVRIAAPAAPIVADLSEDEQDDIVRARIAAKLQGDRQYANALRRAGVKL